MIVFCHMGRALFVETWLNEIPLKRCVGFCAQ
jgi:hypothetical protein